MASKNLSGPWRVLRSGESESGYLDAVVPHSALPGGLAVHSIHCCRLDVLSLCVLTPRGVQIQSLQNWMRLFYKPSCSGYRGQFHQM